MDNLAHLPDYFGHGRTLSAKTPMWNDGTPVPWMTYPAICYLNQLDFSAKQIFEYGCGASTHYWARRAKQVYSVEHDAPWFERTRAFPLANAEISLATGKDYVQAVRRNAPHDVIVVDGRWRADCTIESHGFLAPGGMIIIDNSERYPVLNEFLRGKGFIQVDMVGYGPQNTYIWCTSFFLSRDFSIGPAKAHQPYAGPGMLDALENMPHHAVDNKPTLT
ncbi:MAG: hypothetical protein AB7H70_15065 [Rhodospirillaceae bacterium]